MKLRVLSIGKRMPAWVDDGVAEFLKRFPRTFAVELEAIEPAPRKGGLGTAALQEADCSRLLARIRDGERVVALDERGALQTTREFAGRIEEWQHDARDVVLVIGGPDGHSAAFKQRADELLSLSRMTLPHGLARLFLVEQLYRAWTLMSGHPYHRG
jgi:23S rRNA (pseudouridine1915-N3)-methyltransferase